MADDLRRSLKEQASRRRLTIARWVMAAVAFAVLLAGVAFRFLYADLTGPRFFLTWWPIHLAWAGILIGLVLAIHFIDDKLRGLTP